IVVGRRGRRGQIAWLVVLGGALGYAVAHPVIRSFGSILHIQNLAYSFNSARESLGFDVGSLIVHLLGAAVGALIAVGLGYDSESDKKTSSRTTRLAIVLFAAALFVGMVVLLNGMFQNERLPLYRKLTGYDIVWNVFAWTFMLFFVPMLC